MKKKLLTASFFASSLNINANAMQAIKDGYRDNFLDHETYDEYNFDGRSTFRLRGVELDAPVRSRIEKRSSEFALRAREYLSSRAPGRDTFELEKSFLPLSEEVAFIEEVSPRDSYNVKIQMLDFFQKEGILNSEELDVRFRGDIMDALEKRGRVQQSNSSYSMPCYFPPEME